MIITIRNILFFLGGMLAYTSEGVCQNFTDVAGVMGLQFPYASGNFEYAGSASFADFNLDGLDDLTVATGLGIPIRFFQNNGNGFTELTSPVSNLLDTREVVWVDYDNDGDLDLYATSHHGNKLYKNTGNFQFQDISSTCGFWEPTGWKSYCATWTDYNDDGLPDLCVAFRISYLVGQITLYKNIGNDQFEDVTATAGFGGIGNSVLAMAAFDMNNDGWEDLFIGQDFQAGCLMMKNKGDGTFENISIPAGAAIQNNTMTVTVGDFDNNGWFDVFLTDTSQSTFLKNMGNETFTNAGAAVGLNISGFTFGAQALDANNDGAIDLNLNSTTTSRMFTNNGLGTVFTETTNAWGFGGSSTFSVGLTQGDFNGDGFPDLFKCNKNTPGNSLWQNNFSENNYLSIDLTGTVSNVFAIGAVFKIWTDGNCQMRRVGCGEGFCAQNSHTQFFGVGQFDVVDSLQVIWPSGITNNYFEISVNQRIHFIEFLPILGCMDVLACNYLPEANQDDGACLYAEVFFDCDGNCLIDSDLDGVCDELEIAGCTDESACNFSSEATDDDGTCEFAPTAEVTGLVEVLVSNVTVYASLFIENVNYQWAASPGNSILSGQGSPEIEIQWLVPGMQWVSVVPSVNGCEGETAELFVNVGTIGISEVHSELFSLYPNPASDELHAIFPIETSFPLHFQFFDTSGRMVFQEICNQATTSIRLDNLLPGIYRVVILNRDIKPKSVLKIGY